jgi:hypothetical protein
MQALASHFPNKSITKIGASVFSEAPQTTASNIGYKSYYQISTIKCTLSRDKIVCPPK